MISARASPPARGGFRAALPRGLRGIVHLLPERRGLEGRRRARVDHIPRGAVPEVRGERVQVRVRGKPMKEGPLPVCIHSDRTTKMKARYQQEPSRNLFGRSVSPPAWHPLVYVFVPA